MFGIGMGELVVIAVVLILAVGPDKMPTFLKTVVKGVKQFRQTATDLRSSVALDEIFDDTPRRKLPPPTLQLSDYEQQRESPRFGVDVEHAFSLQSELDDELRDEYPTSGPDVLFEQARHDPHTGHDHT